MSVFNRLGFATLCISLAACSGAATAETIQISAVSFATRAGPTGDASQGVLTNAKNTYYAAVPFPDDGQRVCRFSLVYRDNDAESQTFARLLKKKVILGDVPFTPPVRMAQLNTGIAAGAIGVKRKSTTSIKEAILTVPGAFYYVEIQNTSTLLEVLGVEIEVKPAC